MTTPAKEVQLLMDETSKQALAEEVLKSREEIKKLKIHLDNIDRMVKP